MHALEQAGRMLRECPGTVVAVGVDLALMPAPPNAGLLTSEETMRAAGYINPQDAEWFRRRRIVMRVILGRLFGLRLGNFDLRAAPNGQVHLHSRGRFSSGTFPHFSYSARGRLLVAAFAAEGLVGCDVELNRPCFAERPLAESILSRREFAVLDTVPAAQQRRAVHTAWVAKEAVLKRLGCGLIREPNTVELLDAWDTDRQTWSCREPVIFLDREFMLRLGGEGCAAAVVPSRAEVQLICVRPNLYEIDRPIAAQWAEVRRSTSAFTASNIS